MPQPPAGPSPQGALRHTVGCSWTDSRPKQATATLACHLCQQALSLRRFSSLQQLIPQQQHAVLQRLGGASPCRGWGVVGVVVVGGNGGGGLGGMVQAFGRQVVRPDSAKPRLGYARPSKAEKVGGRRTRGSDVRAGSLLGRPAPKGLRHRQWEGPQKTRGARSSRQAIQMCRVAGAPAALHRTAAAAVERTRAPQRVCRGAQQVYRRLAVLRAALARLRGHKSSRV